jgi:hypothetical protein
VGLERGPLSLVSTTEELLGRNSIGSSLENRKYGPRDVALTTRHPLPAKLGTNFADKRRSVSIVCLQTKAMEYIFFSFIRSTAGLGSQRV